MPDLVRLDFPDTDLFILKSGDWQGFRSNACKKEPETVEWIRSFDTGVFWDVGASVGPYSLIAAALGNKVVAFEPFLPSAGELQQNVWLNELAHLVDVLPLALGSEAHCGIISFQASHLDPGSASHEREDSPHHQTAVGWTIDQYTFLGQYPDYVKIDVDGAEAAVIQGGFKTWRYVKSLMIESEPGTIEDIAVILSAYGLAQTKSWPRMGETRQKNYLFERDA